MASINASTSGAGGIITTADATGNLNIQSGGTTVVALTSAGAAVTGTLSASGAATLSSTLGVTGDLSFNSGYGSAAVAYGCRAWVNFNGTGTVAIRGSGNVSSITDNGTGDYTVNFTTAMPDINYTPNINYSPIYATYYSNGARLFSVGSGITEQAPTTSAFRFSTGFVTGNEQDPKYVLVTVCR